MMLNKTDSDCTTATITMGCLEIAVIKEVLKAAIHTVEEPEILTRLESDGSIIRRLRLEFEAIGDKLVTPSFRM